MGNNHECCSSSSNGIFSGQGLALIIILAIVVVFLTCICGEEESCFEHR